MNKKVLRNLSYGVYVISTWDTGRATGCIANSAMQITSSPATIAVSINHDNYTNECIKRTGKFAISILSEKTDPAIIGTFGFQSGKDTNKFANVDFDVKGYLPVITDSTGYIVCDVIDKMETATHTVFLGEMVEGDVFESADPMSYSYYHKVVKGKSPKNAPTYIPEEDEKTVTATKEKWVCGICKYEYDGDVPFENLPDTFVCPICKQPKRVFKKA